MPTLRNTSIYPTPALLVLSHFVMDHTKAGKYVGSIKISNLNSTKGFRGRCCNDKITIRLAAPDAFAAPITQHYRKKAPKYVVEGWMEVFVSLLAHEISHARDFAMGRGVDEVSCEFQAYRTLLAFREERSQLGQKIIEEVEHDRRAAMAREEKARALKLATKDPRLQAEKLKLRRAIWERKRKTAVTYIANIDKKIRRLEKKLGTEKTEVEGRGS